MSTAKPSVSTSKAPPAAGSPKLAALKLGSLPKPAAALTKPASPKPSPASPKVPAASSTKAATSPKPAAKPATSASPKAAASSPAKPASTSASPKPASSKLKPGVKDDAKKPEALNLYSIFCFLERHLLESAPPEPEAEEQLKLKFTEAFLNAGKSFDIELAQLKVKIIKEPRQTLEHQLQQLKSTHEQKLAEWKQAEDTFTKSKSEAQAEISRLKELQAHVTTEKGSIRDQFEVLNSAAQAAVDSLSKAIHNASQLHKTHAVQPPQNGEHIVHAAQASSHHNLHENPPEAIEHPPANQRPHVAKPEEVEAPHAAESAQPQHAKLHESHSPIPAESHNEKPKAEAAATNHDESHEPPVAQKLEETHAEPETSENVEAAEHEAEENEEAEVEPEPQDAAEEEQNDEASDDETDSQNNDGAQEASEGEEAKCVIEAPAEDQEEY